MDELQLGRADVRLRKWLREKLRRDATSHPALVKATLRDLVRERCWMTRSLASLQGIGMQHRVDKQKTEQLHQRSNLWLGTIDPLNDDKDFLFPSLKDDNPCPIDMSTCWHNGSDNDNYMAWIRRMIPHVHRRDERVYCPYCDMKNHPVGHEVSR